MTDQITAPKLKRETWLDWLRLDMPEDEEKAIARAQPFLSKDHLLAQLADKGVKATARNLVFWQQRGVLPYPSKSRVGRSTIATYPSWMPTIIEALRFYRDTGVSLDRIQALMREMVANQYGRPLTEEGKAAVARDIAQREFRRRLDQIQLSLAQAVIDFDAANNLATGTVELVLHPLAKEQIEQNLLNHAIRFHVTHPLIRYVSDGQAGSGEVFRPVPDLEADMVTWSAGFVWKIDDHDDASNNKTTDSDIDHGDL
jgi:DNA-binding transcriptional MerR regulator